jgi:hypothetical protein
MNVWIPSPLTFEWMHQSSWNLVCLSWHLSPSQMRTSYILPINLCVCMCIPLSLLGNGWVTRYRCNEYTCNKRIAEDVIFYTFRVVWKESRRLVPLWTCFFINIHRQGFLRPRGTPIWSIFIMTVLHEKTYPLTIHGHLRISFDGIVQLKQGR